MNNNYFSNSKYYIASFKSKNYAVQLYYLLERKGYKRFKLISTPCRLKPGCDYALKFRDLSDLKYAKNVDKNFINRVDAIYFVEKKDGKTTYKKVNSAI
ncbi:DUF3343 domain-containing protein [Caldisalinibacter kiritimatiensis]|uniref:Putative Se/S carrier protein-like domain-containing protein n=1 Tax=Caldisalinibacter kiritimatiensis TaxID=1304284 RepID=R1CCE9_9FIRM|nr:DUF3343 domain-containing protein [Caldisalinibacter kiritimatiensis]EOC99964.1 hypothetical protein L21TH_2009 [Caldisalinibacter kiritimatiensis]